MANITQTVTMFEANRKRLKWTITDKATGTALDLTGLVIKLAMARIGDNGAVRTSPLVDKKTGSPDIILVDALNGRVDTILTAADMADRAAAGETTYHVELEVFQSGETQPVVTATVALVVLPNVINA